MNKTSVLKFVKDHQVEISIAAGIVVGALAVYSRYHGKTLLELPANAVQRMKDADIRVVYDVPEEGLFVLTYIPQ